ncbi:hypothetical protein BDP27DRAFT_1339819 [Rhodocollybia butyracea]|uniref:Uncharacterized protein n=1 Tax=Rhodocollybia butyracea TaxID=206335 RepID=A0A9P5TZJ1_9AGAR|nr:hypothetical protein BDP27DRAFT_1339819 [Rhodocollybia butyracea]
MSKTLGIVGQMSSLVILPNSTCGALPEGSIEGTESLRITFIWLYNGLQIFGFLSVTGITLLATFSRRIQRSLTWYNFMLGWVVWCISFSLLIGQQTGGCPAFGLCLFQAALVYAGPPANAFATVAIILQLYFQTTARLNNAKNPQWQTTLISVAPPSLYILIFALIIVFGFLNPSQIQRDTTGMFCGISSGVPTQIGAALVASLSIIMLFFEVKTFTLLYRNWAMFRHIRAETKNSVNSVSLTMIIRVSVFSFLPILALGISLVSATSTSSNLAHISTASLPGAAALIFGTQRDVLSVLMFWRIERKPIKTYIEKRVPEEKADMV